MTKVFMVSCHFRLNGDARNRPLKKSTYAASPASLSTRSASKQAFTAPRTVIKNTTPVFLQRSIAAPRWLRRSVERRTRQSKLVTQRVSGVPSDFARGEKCPAV